MSDGKNSAAGKKGLPEDRTVAKRSHVYELVNAPGNDWMGWIKKGAVKSNLLYSISLRKTISHRSPSPKATPSYPPV